MFSFFFESNDRRFTRRKPGLTLRLSKGLFYIRIMSFLFFRSTSQPNGEFWSYHVLKHTSAFSEEGNEYGPKIWLWFGFFVLNLLSILSDYLSQQKMSQIWLNSQYIWKWTNANPMKILGQLASHPKLLIGSKPSLG